MSKGTVVVTGCSSGIGHAAAIEFATRGYKVIAGARRLEPMEDLKDYGIHVIKLDVTSVESVKALKKLIEDKHNGELKFLFNNAGQPCTFPAIDVTDDQVKQCYEVNVFGPIRLTRELIPYLIKAKGTVGFTGSVSGLLPFPFSSIYSSTKAAIHSFANTLALELEPFGVNVCNFITGGVLSNIADTRSLSKDSWYNSEGIEDVVDKRREMAKRNKPMSPEKYSYKVVNDFENSKKGVVNFYRGSFATVMLILAYLPRIISIRVFKRRFALTALWKSIEAKYSKK